MHLYEITSQYKEFFHGTFMKEEISEADLEALRNLEGEFEDKCIAIASFIKNLEAEADAVDRACIEMRKRRKILCRKIENLLSYLKSHMETMNTHEIKKSPYFKISIKKNPCSLKVLHQESIPREYYEIIPEDEEINWSAVRSALKDGIKVPGAALVTNTRLEIK